MGFHIALGSVLLVDLSILPRYEATQTFSISRSGLSPINASIADLAFEPALKQTFSFFYIGVLDDTNHVVRVAPLDSCPAGEQCSSYFLPGGMDFTSLPMSVSDSSQYPDATVYVQYDAPGYQISFQTLEDNPQISLSTSDCHFYGASNTAVQVCVKQNSSNLVTGMKSHIVQAEYRI
jgi:hypothetical protein